VGGSQRGHMATVRRAAPVVARLRWGATSYSCCSRPRSLSHAPISMAAPLLSRAIMGRADTLSQIRPMKAAHAPGGERGATGKRRGNKLAHFFVLQNSVCISRVKCSPK
jgi:hypothetical protein